MMGKTSHPLLFFMMAFIACMVLMARDSNGDTVCVKTYDVRQPPVSSVYLQDLLGPQMDWSHTLLPKEGATEFQALDYHCQSAPVLETGMAKIAISAKPDEGEWYPKYVRICSDNREYYYDCPWQIQCESNPAVCFIANDRGKALLCRRTDGNGCD